MLTTFVIGLREGLEASLIVGIIAAFLKRNGGAGGTRALRQMWLGVGLAIAICLLGGITLALVSAHLPQRQQEMLECVVAAIAVTMVTYMILWMNAHSRGLKGELENATAGALARGSALALVAMAFLAVLREGFETSVFLLAAFGAAVSPLVAAAGVVLGLAVAIGLGYLIYRGGTRINLSRFFRLTGIVLVLVAGGLVMSTLQAAHEAAWVTVGQQSALNLSWLVRPGSVQASLIGGVLGIQPRPAVIQVVAWLLYVLPMLAVVLWPRKSRLTRPTASRLLLTVGCAGAVVAIALAVFVPSRTDGGPQSAIDVAGTGSVRSAAAAADQAFTGTTNIVMQRVSGSELTAAVSAAVQSADGTQFVAEQTIDLTLAGSAVVGGRNATEYSAQSVSAVSTVAGLPNTVSEADVTAIKGGRLPIGLTAVDPQTSLPAQYVDSWQATVSYDAGSQTVLDAQLHFTRLLQVRNSNGLPISVGTIVDVTTSATPAAKSGQLAAADRMATSIQRHEVWGLVVPSLLGLAALIFLGSAASLAWRRPGTPVAKPPERIPEPVGLR